jgi:hypothetical protein
MVNGKGESNGKGKGYFPPIAKCTRWMGHPFCCGWRRWTGKGNCNDKSNGKSGWCLPLQGAEVYLAANRLPQRSNGLRKKCLPKQKAYLRAKAPLRIGQLRHPFGSAQGML